MKDKNAPLNLPADREHLIARACEADDGFISAGGPPLSAVVKLYPSRMPTLTANQKVAAIRDIVVHIPNAFQPVIAVYDVDVYFLMGELRFASAVMQVNGDKYGNLLDWGLTPDIAAKAGEKAIALAKQQVGVLDEA